MNFGSARKLVEKARIGEVLVQMKLVTNEVIEKALKASKEKGLRLGQYLVAEGIVSEIDLAKALATQFSLDFLDAKDVKPEAEALAKLPYKIAREHKVLPFKIVEGILHLIVFDPLNTMSLARVQSHITQDYLLLVSPETHLLQAIERAYSGVNSIENLVQKIVQRKPPATPMGAGVAIGEASQQKKEGSVEGVINRLIEQALIHRASDIHIEPDEDILRIRERVDGLLQEREKLPLDLHAAMVSRLKILANLDISEKRKSQDGQFRHKFGPRTVDFRLSSLPTIKGEKVVLRILDKSNLKVNLESLDLNPQMAEQLKKILHQPYGMILVTGPTGSGKTTSVYSMINHLNSLTRNIVTIEDPVEYRFPLINQVQINTKIEFTFAAALRTILRQDPDIIMLGEIRDRETAEIAVRAALTGHLLISTIHTNDAPSAITRFVDMGIEPFFVSSSMLGIVSQRLVRRLCSQCKVPVEKINPDTPDFLVDFVKAGGHYYQAKGCEQCFGFGYSGRSAIFEILVPNDEIRAAITHGATSEKIIPLARKIGYQTMFEDGIAKVKSGVTTVDEVLRVVV